MMDQSIANAFQTLTTPLIADAILRLQLPVRAAPPGIQPVVPSQRVAGAVFPVGHYGSVDIFLEAISAAAAGSVLVINNGGRPDEGCIGDLIALEAKVAGLAGIIVWGLHRDTSELIGLDFPVFSYGAYAVGPQRLEPQPSAPFAQIRFGPHRLDQNDLVFADSDGVLFLEEQHAPDVFAVAGEIRDKERRQAALMRRGSSLRHQLRFDQYTQLRQTDRAYTFRQHLSKVDGAVE